MKNHLKAFICILTVIFGLAVPVQAADTGNNVQFFSSVMDLPLIPGFTEELNSNIVFDKPSGRIVETQAVGIMAIDSVKEFYNQSLPQLGWRIIDGNRYIRDGELLELEFSKDLKQTIIYVTLKPAKG